MVAFVTMLRHISLTAAVLSTLAAAGCSSESEPADAPKEVCDELGLCLDEPANGFQVRSEGYEIAAGDDVEYCEVVVLPGDASTTYYVTRFEVAMTEFSHHLIVSAIEPDTDTDANAAPGDRVPCTGGDVFGGELLPVTGSQLPYHETVYPDRVGRVYTGGQKLVFDYHYFNTSPEPIRARAAVNFHTTDASKIDRIVQSFGMVNLAINIPPMSDAEFTRECPLNQEMEVFSLTRHTHKWGTDFEAWFHGGERDGEHIFHSPSYEENVDHQFDEPVRLNPGEGFAFKCAFRNTEDHTLTFGLKATDEMCILFGDWYVPLDMEDREPFQDGCLITQ